MPDFDDARDAVRRADLDTLRRLIDDGWDVNECEHWSGITALQLAADADNADMVELLLRHGADPNSSDNDGYFAYGVHSSRRIRELLLAYGYSWSRWQPTFYAPDTVVQLRVLAPREPATDRWTETVTGTDLFVEHLVLDLPVPAGEATVSVTLDGREGYTATLATPGHERHRLTTGDAAPASPAREASPCGPRKPPAQATITVRCRGFVGEFWVRLFSSAAVDRLEGDRTFWLPDYSMYQIP